MCLSVNMWRWLVALLTSFDRTVRLDREFEFMRADIEAIRCKRGLFSTGIIVEHRKADYPPFFLYWPLRYAALRDELRRQGYDVIDSAR
jgi:hypothetical protein